MRLPRIVAAISIVVLAAVALTGCSAKAAPHRIGLLLPDNATSRYATDHADFVAAIAKLDPTAKVSYGNGNGSGSQQLAQAEAMLKAGVKVLVLDPYDPQGAADILAKAKARHVAVIDYDTLLSSGGASYFVGPNDELAGELQAKAVVAKLKSSGAPSGSGILMVEGDANSATEKAVAKGAHSVFDSSGVTVLAEYQTPGGVPSFAAQWTQAQLTKFGDKVGAVYASTDGLAAGAITAATAAGVDPSTLAIPGWGASFPAIQNLLANTQLMTLYSPIKPQATRAATLAIALAGGTHPSAPATVTTATGSTMPAYLLAPIPVTTANIRSTVVKDGFATAARICTPAYAARCAALGIK